MFEFFCVEEQNIQRDVEKRLMNILVIGNGFDLAHGLPTKYGDFLRFIKIFFKYRNLEEKLRIPKNKREKYIKNLLKEETKHRLVCELGDLKYNGWVKHFTNVQIKDGWIDFENEISKVIQTLDDAQKSCSWKQINNFLDEFNIGRTTREKEIGNIRDRCEEMLDSFIRCFEIYLSDYVNNLPVNKKLSCIEELNIDKVLSFNYTNTYHRVYCPDKNDEEWCDYIHGKAKIDNTIHGNNMVLGIDEYLSEDRKNRDLDFIAFKKYYQRIYKGTGSKYKNWIEEVRESRWQVEEESRGKYSGQIPLMAFPEVARHNLYIYGHSLDITDKDILRELILNDNVKTTIFYPDKKDLGKKIANLVKVIGQDELIRRTGGSTKTIEFRLQQDVVELEI